MSTRNLKTFKRSSSKKSLFRPSKIEEVLSSDEEVAPAKSFFKNDESSDEEVAPVIKKKLVPKKKLIIKKKTNTDAAPSVKKKPLLDSNLNDNDDEDEVVAPKKKFSFKKKPVLQSDEDEVIAPKKKFSFKKKPVLQSDEDEVIAPSVKKKPLLDSYLNDNDDEDEVVAPKKKFSFKKKPVLQSDEDDNDDEDEVVDPKKKFSFNKKPILPLLTTNLDDNEALSLTSEIDNSIPDFKPLEMYTTSIPETEKSSNDVMPNHDRDYIYHNDFTNVKSLEKYIKDRKLHITKSSELTTLVLSSKDDTDFDTIEIENLKNLFRLDANGYKDITITGDFLSLQYIHVKSMLTSCINPSKLGKLMSLHLKDIRSVDILIDERFKTLNGLTIDHCYFKGKQLEITTDFDCLEELKIINCNLISFEANFNVSNIIIFDLSNNKLENLSVKTPFVNLSCFRIEGNKLSRPDVKFNLVRSPDFTVHDYEFNYDENVELPSNTKEIIERINTKKVVYY